jgi:hypothetical protein
MSATAWGRAVFGFGISLGDNEQANGVGHYVIGHFSGFLFVSFMDRHKYYGKLKCE